MFAFVGSQLMSLSEFDSRNQLVLKLVALLAALAELGGDKEVPTEVYGLNLPGYGTKNFRPELVTVEWDTAGLFFNVTYESLKIESADHLQWELRNLLAKVKSSLWDFAASIESPKNLKFSYVYRLDKSQLRHLHYRLGGTEDTTLLQAPSREALLFVQIDTATRRKKYFFKSSAPLDHISLLWHYNVGHILVLPEDLIPIRVNSRSFYKFKAYDQIDRAVWVKFLPSVIEALDSLHKAGIAHCDVRWENMVKFGEGDDQQVRFIDLERCCYAYSCPSSYPTSVWYPFNLSGAQLDWHQLGVSLLRWGNLDLDKYVEKAPSFGQYGVEGILKSLLVDHVKPTSELEWSLSSFSTWVNTQK
eukprot:Rmarinus@m.23053